PEGRLGFGGGGGQATGDLVARRALTFVRVSATCMMLLSCRHRPTVRACTFRRRCSMPARGRGVGAGSTLGAANRRRLANRSRLGVRGGLGCIGRKRRRAVP